VVKIFRHAFGGRTHGLDYFTKGDLVGEECIFSESPRTNEAVAYEDVTALAVEKSVFIELGQRKSLVLERIGRSITEKKKKFTKKNGTRSCCTGRYPRDWPAYSCDWRRNLGFEIVEELF